MKYLRLMIVILLFNTTSFSQNYETEKWSFSFSGGLALPVGTFAKNDPADAAVYMPEVQNPWIIGFDKSKDGFAKKGYYYDASVTYRIKNGITFSLHAGQSKNPVDEDAIENFLIEKYGSQDFEHVDYNVSYLAPGIGYDWAKEKWGIGINIFAGYGKCNYPYYQSTLYYISSPSIWAHDGDQPELFSLAYGGTLTFNYKISRAFKAGLDLTYFRSDFDYTMSTRVIPGFSPNPEIDDTIKVSLLNFGIKLSYLLY